MSEQGVTDENPQGTSPEKAIAALAEYIYQVLPPESSRFRAAKRKWTELREYHLEKYGADSIFSILPENIGPRDTRFLTGTLLNLFRKSYGTQRISILATLPEEELERMRGTGPKTLPLVTKIRETARVVLFQSKQP